MMNENDIGKNCNYFEKLNENRNLNVAKDFDDDSSGVCRHSLELGISRNAIISNGAGDGGVNTNTNANDASDDDNRNSESENIEKCHHHSQSRYRRRRRSSSSHSHNIEIEDDNNRQNQTNVIVGIDSSTSSTKVDKSKIIDRTYKPKENNLPSQLVNCNYSGNYKSKSSDSDGDRDKNGEKLKMVRNNEEGNAVGDGADEKMLGSGEEKTLTKKDEVKFISGSDQQNGDAKIDIGNLDKAFTGMTKEELMKYANDPFWIRLRWIFFILFWLIWAGMLVGAILIIINAPKCAAPIPLPWYKQGPLIKFKSNEMTINDIEQAKKIKAKGAIYELSADETYSVKEPMVENKIKKLIENYKNTNINIILDLTPNYVTNNSKLFKEILENPERHSSFIWAEEGKVPTTWKSIVNGSAWYEIKPQKYILSQFGEGKYDLFMNDSYVKEELKNVLFHLIELGVRGFRFTNAKYFILKKDLEDESPKPGNNFIHDEYGFWTHQYTTFQDGLGDLLYEFTSTVKNACTDDIFLSVNEDTIRSEKFKTNSGIFGIDIPIYSRFTNLLKSKPNSIAKSLYQELNSTIITIGDTWLQWVYHLNNLDYEDPSAYYIFMSILPGTPVIEANSVFLNLSSSLINQVENIRLSPSYMHGDFDIYHSEEIVAYSRIKSGNPGYFTVFNPTETYVVGNFSYADLPDKMTIDVLSHNFNVTDVVVKGKVSTDAIQLSPLSAAVLTYVPVKKN